MALPPFILRPVPKRGRVGTKIKYIKKEVNVNGKAGAGDSSVNIALLHIKTALVLLPVFFISVFLTAKDFNRYFFMNTQIISVTHVYTLGFLLMVIMGASYMLLPVALGVKIAYEKLFYPVYYVYTVSFAIFAVGMYLLIPYLIAIGGFLLFAALIVYLINMAVSMKRVTKWDYSSFGILSGYIYLFLGIIIGFYLAFSFYVPYISFNLFSMLRDHVLAMAAGFVVMFFIAVSYRLLPMFYMTKNPVPFVWKTDLAVMDAGLAAILVSSFFKGPAGIYISFIGEILLVFGILVYCFEFFALMSGRMNKKIDVTVLYLYTGIIFLALSALAGLVFLIAPGRSSDMFYGSYYSFGFIGLFMFAGMVIIGFLHKIFPFLISLKVFEKSKKGAYGKLFGSRTSMYFEMAVFVLFLAGGIIESASMFFEWSTLIEGGSALLVVASVMFLSRLFLMIRG